MSVSLSFNPPDTDDGRKFATMGHHVGAHSSLITAPCNAFRILSARMTIEKITGDAPTGETESVAVNDVTIFANPRRGWSIVEADGTAIPVDRITEVVIGDTGVIYTDPSNAPVLFT